MENGKKVDYGKANEELSQEATMSVFKPKVGAVFVDILEEPVETTYKDEKKGTFTLFGIKPSLSSIKIARNRKI